MANKTKVVKFPVDVLKSLEKDFPSMSNPARIRLMHMDYEDMKELKNKVKKAGEIVYGKNAWQKRYNK